jgi:hypothetical protein
MIMYTSPNGTFGKTYLSETFKNVDFIFLSIKKITTYVN